MRGTPAGDAYLDLRNAARRTRRRTDELLQLYVLEGFLARLAVSDARRDFILKGGVLLAAFGSRRPTKDIDLAGIDMSNDTETVMRRMAEVVDTRPSTDDGIDFLADTMTSEVIREGDSYSGVRVHLVARLATAVVGFHIDINVGDPIWPKPTTVALPRLRGGEPLNLRGYPMHMVHAEKIATAVQRGSANTRWRDFADVHTLSRRHPVAADDLTQAIEVVARHRAVPVRPLAEVLDGFADIAQTSWVGWRRRSNSEHVPERFSLVLEQVIDFADPVIHGAANGTVWDPTLGRWA